jgi:hypothetical protein
VYVALEISEGGFIVEEGIGVFGQDASADEGRPLRGFIQKS